MNVFQHDYRVIDHQPDGQHERQQREQVDAVAEKIQHDAGSDERYRQRCGRHQHRPHIAEEQPDNGDHQQGRDRQRLVDLIDRALDVYRGIPALQQLHAIGQRQVGAVALAFDRPRHRERVGGALLDDADTDHRHAVGAKLLAILRGAEFHLGHVAETHQVPVAALAEHQRPEIPDAAVTALHAHHEIALGRAYAAGRKLDVLALQGRLDVRHRQRPSRECVAIQPDAHRVIETTAHVDLRHTIDHRKAVGNVAVGIIRQFETIETVADEAHPQDHAT